MYEKYANQRQYNTCTERWIADSALLAFSGIQNSIRYAYFKSHDRLIIQRDGQEIIYNTESHMLTGVSQQQSDNTRHLVFRTQDGKTLSFSDFETVNS